MLAPATETCWPSTARKASSAPSTLPGTRGRTEHRVLPEHVGDCGGVGVEVEEPAATLDRGTKVPEILQLEHAVDVVAAVRERHGTGAERQAQRSPVGLPVEVLDAGHGPRTEKTQHAVRIERLPERQPEWDPPGIAIRVVPAQATQFLRRGREDLADGVVELPDARETGGERDLGDRKAGGLDEQPGRVGAPRAGDRERPSSDLGCEQTVQVALRVAEAPREAKDAVPVHDPVGDEPHSPGHDVRPEVPLRRAWHGVGPAPLARAETGALRGRGARIEAYVRPPGRYGRTTWPAVDARGSYGDVEPAVEAGVTAPHDTIAMFEVL